MSLASNKTKQFKKKLPQTQGEAKAYLDPFSSTIKEIKVRLDTNYRKISSAKRAKRPYSQINKLLRERKTIVRELQAVREERKSFQEADI